MESAKSSENYICKWRNSYLTCETEILITAALARKATSTTHWQCIIEVYDQDAKPKRFQNKRLGNQDRSLPSIAPHFFARAGAADGLPR